MANTQSMEHPGALRQLPSVRTTLAVITGVEVTRDLSVLERFLASSLPEFGFRVVCSKGFYVRTYAHEIGVELGCGAHLSALRRTKSGKFLADGAISFDELKNGSRESVAARALSLADVSRLRGA